MITSHKIELRPTRSQHDYLAKCAGTMRYVYNQLVSKSQNEKYGRKTFQKFCVNLRQSTPWMKDVASRACYEAADNFHRAMTNFFDSCMVKRKGRRYSKPSFKKKGVRDKFQFSSPSHFKVEGRKLKIQGLKEKIWMRERIRFDGTVKAVSVSYQDGKWFATFRIETTSDTQPSQEAARKPSVGIDLGISQFAVLSTGETIANPRHLRRKLRLLRRRQKQVSSKVKGSRRRERAKAKVSRLHRKISDKRYNFQHLIVNSLMSQFGRIVIEDLNVSGMVKNKKLSRSISDVAWGSFRQKLEYKSKRNNVELVVADRFYPSTKTCCRCGNVKSSISLNERTFTCEKCGSTMNRDLNAAINLERYPSPPIIGRRKTDVRDLCQTSEQSEAGSFDCVNTENLQPRATC